MYLFHARRYLSESAALRELWKALVGLWKVWRGLRVYMSLHLDPMTQTWEFFNLLPQRENWAICGLTDRCIKLQREKI